MPPKAIVFETIVSCQFHHLGIYTPDKIRTYTALILSQVTPASWSTRAFAQDWTRTSTGFLPSAPQADVATITPPGHYWIHWD